MRPILWFVMAAALAVAFFAYSNRRSGQDQPARRTDPLTTVLGAERFGPDILAPVWWSPTAPSTMWSGVPHRHPELLRLVRASARRHPLPRRGKWGG